jgi:ABC-type glycerol-3-phosphate transport system substrate-binding protein
MAVPLGMPAWVLLYRRDLFAAQGLEPPENWQDYQRLAEVLVEAFPRHVPPPNAGAVSIQTVIEPLASPWAAYVLLARAAGYARHPAHYPSLWSVADGRPLIDAPPFVRALEELCQLQAVAAMPLVDPMAARRAAVEGRAAMVWTWLSAAGRNDRLPAQREELEVALLPAASHVYDPLLERWEPRAAVDDGRVSLIGWAGRIGSVTSSSRNAAAAFRLLAWLAGPEMGAAIGSASAATALFRRSQLTRPELWVDPAVTMATARDYAKAVEETLSRPVYLDAPRIPNATQYTMALDAAVHLALEGRVSPAESLRQAAAAWREIAHQSGASAQRDAVARSVGVE